MTFRLSPNSSELLPVCFLSGQLQRVVPEWIGDGGGDHIPLSLKLTLDNVESDQSHIGTGDSFLLVVDDLTRNGVGESDWRLRCVRCSHREFILTTVWIDVSHAATGTEFVFPRLQCDVARLLVVLRAGCSLRHQPDFGDTERADLAGLEVVSARKQVVPGSEVDLHMFTFGILYARVEIKLPRS